MASKTVQHHSQAGAGAPSRWGSSAAGRSQVVAVAAPSSTPLLGVAPTRLAQQQQPVTCASSARQAQRVAVLARAYKRNAYTDINNTSLGSMDSLDQFDSSFNWTNTTATPQGVWDLPPAQPQQQNRNNNAYGGYANNRWGAAQQRASYVTNGSLDDLDEDDYSSGGMGGGRNEGFASGPGGDAGSQSRTIHGRHISINREITAQVVRVIAGEGGKVMKGVMGLQDALNMARESNLDLVLLNPEAQPPLCRLIVWSKYKYEVEKDQKKKASKAVVVETKEVRLRPNTDSGDLKTKLKSAQKFLEKGNKLKLVMKFEGRELQYKEQGKGVMLKFVEDLGVVGKVDGPINFKTGAYTALLSPTGRTMDAAAPAPAPAAPAPAVAAAAGLLPAPPQLPPQAPQPAAAAAAPPAAPPAPPSVVVAAPAAPAAPAAAPPAMLPPTPLPMPPARQQQPAAAPLPPRPLQQPVGAPAGAPPRPGGLPLPPAPPRPAMPLPGQGAPLGRPANRPGGAPLPMPPPPPMGRPPAPPGMLTPSFRPPVPASAK